MLFYVLFFLICWCCRCYIIREMLHNRTHTSTLSYNWEDPHNVHIVRLFDVNTTWVIEIYYNIFVAWSTTSWWQYVYTLMLLLLLLGCCRWWWWRQKRTTLPTKTLPSVYSFARIYRERKNIHFAEEPDRRQPRGKWYRLKSFFVWWVSIYRRTLDIFVCCFARTTDQNHSIYSPYDKNFCFYQIAF